MAQFIGKATEYLPFGSVKLFAPPKAEDCGTNQIFCQPTEQTDNITFQFLAAETVNLVTDGDFPDGSHNSICGIQNWCGQGWGIVDGEAFHLTGSSNPLVQQSVFTLNEYFKLTYTISGMANEDFVVDPFFNTILQDGTYTFYKIWTIAGFLDLTFGTAKAFRGSVSDVEVVQVATATDYTIEIFDVETGLTIDTVPPAAITGSTENNVITVDFNWADDVTVTNGCREIRVFLEGGSVGNPGNIFEDTFDTNQGWSTLGGVIVPSVGGPFMEFFFTGDFVNAAFISIFDVGVVYTVTYDVINYASGEVTLKVGNTVGTTRNANGTYTETLVCTTFGNLSFLFAPVAGVGDLDVDNVIVSKLDNFDGQSECFDLQDSHDCSLMFVWSNENRWGSYDYSVLIDRAIVKFQHELRVICNFRGTKYPSDRNIGEDSAGVKSMDYSNMRKIKLLDIDFAPDYIHDAIAAFFMHDNRTINGTSYIMDDEYEPSTPNDSRVIYKDLMRATIEIEETTQPNLINRNE